jgi:hypothetical protein
MIITTYLKKKCITMGVTSGAGITLFRIHGMQFRFKFSFIFFLCIKWDNLLCSFKAMYSATN